MSVNSKTTEVIPAFITEARLAVLKALKHHGGDASFERIANYLLWEIEDVLNTAQGLSHVKCVKITEDRDLKNTRMGISQYGEIALLAASGLDFHGYVELEIDHIETWRDYYRDR